MARFDSDPSDPGDTLPEDDDFAEYDITNILGGIDENEEVSQGGTVLLSTFFARRAANSIDKRDMIQPIYYRPDENRKIGE